MGALCQVAKWGRQCRLKAKAGQRPEACLGCGRMKAVANSGGAECQGLYPGAVGNALGRSRGQKGGSKAPKGGLKSMRMEEGNKGGGD